MIVAFDHPDAVSILGIPFKMDCFENSCHKFNDFPLMRDHINSELSKVGMRLSEKDRPHCFVSHGVGYFSIQGHTASVEEHTDDVRSNDRFGVLPIGYETPEEGSRLTRFDCRPVFNFYQGLKKHSERMKLGEVLTFNPSKKHSMVFYGHKMRYLIFDVENAV